MLMSNLWKVEVIGWITLWILLVNISLHHEINFAFYFLEYYSVYFLSFKICFFIYYSLDLVSCSSRQAPVCLRILWGWRLKG